MAYNGYKTIVNGALNGTLNEKELLTLSNFVSN